MEIKESRENGAVVLEISGRLDVTNSETVQEKFIELADSGETSIVLDCSNLEYISSSGLRAFLLLVKKMNAAKGKCAIANLKPDIKEVFDISGFTGLFTVSESREDALKAVS